MDTLFTHIESARKDDNAPLAVRMRPTTLDGFVGQERAVGPGSWLRRAIEHDTLSSVLLFGPAGTGKTTLARIIAHTTHAEFVEVSAVTGTVKDLRREIEAAESRLISYGRRTILFVDEIHRFNRGQQDALLHAVEDRTVVLVGATTENPYFEVNSALISRSRVVELQPLDDDSIRTLLERACASERGLGGAFELSGDAEREIVTLSAGDGRAALTSLELASQMVDPDPDAAPGEPAVIGPEHVREANPRRGLPYDKSGDVHYDVISAFIKSMRGSDPDAALYWLARMLDAGEDPKFIARRIMICSSEDVGNADPQALLVAEAAFRATEVIGLPECRINLAQAACYLALAPKSNAAEAGIDAALSEVRSGPRREVPSHLRDRHRPGADEYGPYLYPHNYPAGWVSQRYLPEGLERGGFYRPSPRGWEAWREEAIGRDCAQADQNEDPPVG
ncbi:replication-associated recombination protein A [Thermophilibacter immobilis]|jgi:putative ATPase|uniref:Replication-associated recombination protein A n=1 Tax=Thermophilibacter immobilis TaxID=2779519 RepID=A0A7S7M7K5_9ACTN|nr:replication-associated recombination protein A [Thermophilibacter immobilis]QOY60103.1 replication-associated recombination protein A [Thermophilibacter immobilis]